MDSVLIVFYFFSLNNPARKYYGSIRKSLENRKVFDKIAKWGNIE